jgi:hypothetical protein
LVVGPWGGESPRATTSPSGDGPVLTGRRTLERGASPRSRNAAGAIPRGESGPCDPRRVHHHRRIGAPGGCRPDHPYSPRRRAQRAHERRLRSRLAEAGPGPGSTGTAHSGDPGDPRDTLVGSIAPRTRCRLGHGRGKLGIGSWALGIDLKVLAAEPQSRTPPAGRHGLSTERRAGEGGPSPFALRVAALLADEPRGAAPARLEVGRW